MAKTGIVSATFVVRHLCDLMDSYGTSMKGAIDAAATAGKITTAEANAAKAFLDTAVAMCSIFRAVSGY